MRPGQAVGQDRAVRSCISDSVEGFQWAEGSRDWRVEDVLREKVQEWREERKENKEAGGGCYEHRCISEVSEDDGEDDPEEILLPLIESHRWTVVIPLPVITELGLASPNGNQPQLAEVAQAALACVFSHLRSHALNLKVQTSRGNYLTSLSIRTEELDFAFGGGDGVENKGRNRLRSGRMNTGWIGRRC